MPNPEIIFTAANETAQMDVGRKLAIALRAPLCIYLQGDLGAGKTTLVRGLLRALGHQAAVRSPTYTLMEPYAELSPACYHFDLYRLCDPEELEYLGIRDLLDGPVILLFEWPERGAGYLPAADLLIDIHSHGSGRLIKIKTTTEMGRQVCQRLTSLSGEGKDARA